VSSSNGHGYYTVTYIHAEDNYMCTCEHYEHRKTHCRHIKSVMKTHCKWVGELTSSSKACPNCKGPLIRRN
jgi:hypothetical protein